MRRLVFTTLLVLLLFALAAWGSPFVPDEPTMPYSQVRRGMTGFARTVVRGQKIVSFPVEVMDLIRQKGVPSRFILIRAWGSVINQLGGMAAGMSGSPVYINGKLVGAFSYGWDFSDHKMGLVTPIEDMIKVFDYPDEIPRASVPLDIGRRPTEEQKNVDLRIHELLEEKAKQTVTPRLGTLTASGLSPRAMQSLSRKLGNTVIQSGGFDNVATDEPVRLRPGNAVSAMLVWGDVTLEGTGTLSAIGKDGRFLAFGHSFKSWGAVAYPLAEAYVYATIPGIESPFKIASSGRIVGIITQDRGEGVGGYFSRYAPAISINVEVEDRERKTVKKNGFRVIQNLYQATRLLPDLMSGLADRMLGRTSSGSALYTLSIQGGPLRTPWVYQDRSESSDDIIGSVVTSVSSILDQVLMNPFENLTPLSINLRISVTSETERLNIREIRLSKDVVSPGESVTADVVLQPWRKRAIHHRFLLKVPEDADGVLNVIVRGGNEAESSSGQNEVVMERRISSLSEFLDDISSREHACEVIVELNGNKDEESNAGLLPAEARRQKLGQKTMRIFKSNYVVEGNVQMSLSVSADQ